MACGAAQRIVQPFIFQAIAESPHDAQSLLAHLGQRQISRTGQRRAIDRAARKANKKIRIGYVSGEFRQQATAILMAGAV